MAVLEEFSLGLRLSKKFLAHLKMSSGLVKCFVFVLFCIICLSNILRKVLEHFSHSSSHLKVIGLNSGLKFSCKVLSHYLSQGTLIFLYKGLF